MYTLFRLSFFDGDGFDYIKLLAKDHPFLFCLCLVYLALTSFGILNGLTGIFGTAFQKASHVAFEMNDSESDDGDEDRVDISDHEWFIPGMPPVKEEEDRGEGGDSDDGDSDDDGDNSNGGGGNKGNDGGGTPVEKKGNSPQTETPLNLEDISDDDNNSEDETAKAFSPSHLPTPMHSSKNEKKGGGQKKEAFKHGVPTPRNNKSWLNLTGLVDGNSFIGGSASNEKGGVTTSSRHNSPQKLSSFVVTKSSGDRLRKAASKARVLNLLFKDSKADPRDVKPSDRRIVPVMENTSPTEGKIRNSNLQNSKYSLFEDFGRDGREGRDSHVTLQHLNQRLDIQEQVSIGTMKEMLAKLDTLTSHIQQQQSQMGALQARFEEQENILRLLKQKP